jgi:hypothetical protein
MGGRVLVGVAALAGVHACAAVTGLSDYEVVGDGGDGGESGDAASGSSSGTASGSSSGTGSSSSSSGDGATPPPPPDPIAGYARARCASLQRCLPGRYAAYYRTEADCENDVRHDAPAATQQQFDACAAKLDGAECRFDERDLPECTFNGTLPVDAPCSGNSQCATGRCQRAAGVACGKCAARVPADGTCTSSSDCAAGLYCNDNDKCKPESGLNDSCTFGTVPCAAGLTCAPNKCKEAADVGATCTFGECRSNLSCANGRCAEDKYSTVGGDCGFQSSGSFIHCVGSSCSGALGAAGKCQAYLPAGATCSTDPGKPDCDPAQNLTCTGGTCQPRAPTVCN